MNIKVVLISELKNKHILFLIKEYQKRINSFAKIEFLDFKKTIKISDLQAKFKNYYFILLDEKGKSFTSLEFSAQIQKTISYQNSNLIFVIGDSDGFSDSEKVLANEIISLSKMTFPHEMASLFLIEQIYRSLSILNNHPYHRE